MWYLRICYYKKCKFIFFVGKKENILFFKCLWYEFSGIGKKKEVIYVSWFFFVMLKIFIFICEKGKFIEWNIEKNNEIFNIVCWDRFIKNIF